MLKFSLPFSLFAATVCLLMLGACSPKYNWREVHGTGAPFTVLLPDKPATFSRPIDLDGSRITMTMTAAEVDGVTFALGSAQMPDAARAQAALYAMKTALVQNIKGTVRHEKSFGAAQAPAGTAAQAAGIEIEASGSAGAGKAVVLFARFAAQDKRIYQAVVVGPEKNIPRDAVETFLGSFRLN